MQRNNWQLYHSPTYVFFLFHPIYATEFRNNHININYLIFLYIWFSFQECYLQDRIPDSVDKVISLYSSANNFFIDYNVYHIKWLHHSSTTDLADIQTANISTAQILTQIDFPTRSGRNVTLLELFIISCFDSCRPLQICPRCTRYYADIFSVCQLGKKPL